MITKNVTRGEVQDLIDRMAASMPRYREALIRDPKGVLERQLNTSLGGVRVEALLDTPDTVHIVVPHVAAEGELSDSDLEKVAGGKGDTIAVACAGADGAIMATMTDINI